MSLIERLKTERPSIAFSITHTPENGIGATEEGNPSFVLMVTAVTIRDGELITGCDSVAGVFLTLDSVPQDLTPHVDLLAVEALTELEEELSRRGLPY